MRSLIPGNECTAGIQAWDLHLLFLFLLFFFSPKPLKWYCRPLCSKRCFVSLDTNNVQKKFLADSSQIQTLSNSYFHLQIQAEHAWRNEKSTWLCTRTWYGMRGSSYPCFMGIFHWFLYCKNCVIYPLTLNITGNFLLFQKTSFSFWFIKGTIMSPQRHFVLIM